ncbi:MAG: beta-ketoacyl-ACP synthase II [Bacteroidetes bacterium]|nr:beta-ketoacyl-ACP synthase II [Bacteroidota bacterium]
MELKRVVVTGLGTINPIGNNVKEFFKSLQAGISGASLITRFDITNFKCKVACEVKNFVAEDYLDRKQAKKMDLFAQYAIAASDEAVKDSGLTESNTNLERVGIVWASGIGGLTSLQEEVKGYTNGGCIPRFSPFFIPKMIIDIAAGHLSMRYGYKGPNFSTVSACASSNNAIIDALNLIRLGKADAILTGGSEASVTEAGMGGFASMRAISSRNDDPKTASRPYDADRDGFVLAEGSGALMFEELEHAKARGAKIYAEVLGGGMSADAYHLTAPHPEGDGARRSMSEALIDANITTKDVDYINTHGTSTPVGDLSELKGVQALFGENIYDLNISSTKSMHGHLLGATGAVEAIACIMAITESVVPPTINVQNVDPALDSKINLTLDKAQKREINVAMSNTFGFGGHNSTVILKKYNE